MRCYFLQNEIIKAVEVVRCTSDDEGIEHASQIFERRKEEFAGFELWDGNRLVHQHPVSVRRLP